MIKKFFALILIATVVLGVRYHAIILHKPDVSASQVVQQVEDTSNVEIYHPPVLDIPTLLADTNKERVAAGLQPLVETSSLESSAAAKCADMEARNYWAHDTPDGKTPWTFFTKTWHYEGENLAKEMVGSDLVTNAWMNSPKHRANLLSPNYTNIGFAVCTGPQHSLVVQHFGG